MGSIPTRSRHRAQPALDEEACLRIALSNPRPKWGGASTTLALLARGLSARGHDVLVLCRPRSALYRELHAELACAPVLHGVDFPPGPILRAARALRRQRSEVLLSSMNNDTRLSVPAARLVGIPAVARRVGMQPFEPGLLQRRADRLVHHFVVNSLASREVVLRSGPWLAPGQVSVIYNGVDADAFASAVPAQLGLPAGAVAVGFVGRLDPEKGADVLTEAWAAIAAAEASLHLVIAGEGPLEGELRERLREVPRVHWIGFRRDVPGIMRALDLVVVPSRSEAFGNAALEAMAAGRPVIATRTGGLPEVVLDEVTGLLIPPDDAPALAEAVLALARNPGRRRALAQAGQLRARRDFSLAAVLEGYEALLMRIAGRGRPRP